MTSATLQTRSNILRCIEIGEQLPDLEKRRTGLRGDIENVKNALDCLRARQSSHGQIPAGNARPRTASEISKKETELCSLKLRLKGLNDQVTALLAEHAALGGTPDTIPLMCPNEWPLPQINPDPEH